MQHQMQQSSTLAIAGYPVLLSQTDTDNGARLTIHPAAGPWPGNVMLAVFDAADKWCHNLIENVPGCSANVQRENGDIAIVTLAPTEDTKVKVYQGVETLRTMLASLTLTHGAGAGTAGGSGGSTEEGSHRGDIGGIEEVTA